MCIWTIRSIFKLPNACLSLLLLSSLTFAAPPTAPFNISCQGWEANTVRFYWAHDDENVTEFRVQKNVDGDGWNTVSTVESDDPKRYFDTEIDTDKNHRYRVRAFNDVDDTSATSAICNNRKTYTTEHFRIFYGLRGTSDDCPQIDGRDVCLDNINEGSANRYVKLAGDAMEDSLGAFPRVGFGADKGTEAPGDLDKIPVNVVWCDGGGCAGGGGLGLSPLLLEEAFDFATRVGDPVAYIVSLHEVFHFLQGDYPGLNDPAGAWVIEGQARSTQDKFCMGDDRATCYDFDDIDTGTAGYVPQVDGYMTSTFRAINELSYSAALFWTYLTEKYGNEPDDSDTVENGMNLMVTFWEEVEADGSIDGISALNKALDTLGHSERFKDIWKDFSVANYAKNLSGPGVDSKYLYDDMAETGGTYDPVMLLVNQPITSADQIIRTGEFVEQWGANYYEIQPDPSVLNVDIKITQNSLSTLYFTVLGIQGTDITFEENGQSRDFELNLPNDSFDKVVVIVSALEQLANYRISINGVDPVLSIKRPTTGNTAAVGDPAAPEKFLVALELVDGDGVPITGVDLTDFSFTVGGEAVTDADIITASTVQDQHWFVIRAPAQTTNGLFDLQADYAAGQTAVEADSVNYAARNDVDSMITLDRSGSMDDFDKFESAQDAAKLFIDSWRSGDKLGLVSFADEYAAAGAITVNLLTPWTDSPGGGSRQEIFDQIDSLMAESGTALGDGLQASWDELVSNGDPAHDWAIVLLSDGLQTSGSANFPDVVRAIRDSSGSKPVIHAVAVGPDADQREMQQAATSTNGTYQYISLPATAGATSMSVMASSTPSGIDSNSVQLDFDQRYRVVASKMDNLQQIFNFIGPMASDGNPYQDLVVIPVENGAAELVLSLSFDGVANANIELRDPDGSPVPLFQSNLRHLIWRVANPLGGNWTLELEVPVISKLLEVYFDFLFSSAYAQSTEYLPPYLVHAALRSETRMDMYFPLPASERIVGSPMPIVVSLTDNTPVVGASVTAQVSSPNGSVVSFGLFDDGSHGDGAAGDGIYGGNFNQTQTEGSYGVFVTALGNSSLSGPFSRRDTGAFFMYGGGDADGDLLPDAWEQANGTDVTIDDSNADPDTDGVPNWKEYEQGTLPLDPDSDDGGESDDTDIDPNDPTDDRIQPTWGKAYAGVEVVHLLYVNRPDYIQIDFYRSSAPSGPYTLVDSLYPGDGLYSDTTVVNSQQYCYLVVAENALGARSAPLNPTCATPSDDPFAPYGYVRINDGQPITASVNVNLTLWASDAVDPESELVFYETIFPADAPNSGVSEMMISNHPLLAGASWEPYSLTKPWTLLPDNGTARVFAKFRDANGNESDIVNSRIDIVTLDISQCSDRPLMTASDFALLAYSHSELTNHHVKGRLAIGGNALLKKVHLNGNPRKKNLDGINSLVVGSDLEYHKGTVNRGNIVYAGSQQINNVKVKGSVLQAYPISFGVEHAQIKLRSQLWASLPTSISVVSTMKKNGTLILQGDEQLNVFNLTVADFIGVKKIEVRGSKNATALVNVAGSNVNLNGIKVKSKGINSSNILFNFAQADTLSITNSDWGASILAPYATVDSEDNQYRSNVVVGSMQDNDSHTKGDLFAKCLPLPVTP